MRLTFHTLDVFTEQRFGGNPLAVVLEADALDSAAMQAIAREFNLSETVFILKSEKPAHTARLRIFTPRGEIPFAGHPTVGAACLLAELRMSVVNGERDAIIMLEEEVGTVRVGVRLKSAAAAFAEFDAPKLPEEILGVPDHDTLAAALGILPTEIGFENHRATRFGAGLPYTFVPVRNLEVIGRLEVSAGRWNDAFGPMGAVYVYCRETVHHSAQLHARMYDPGHGIPEDPATGSAAAALAGVVHRFDGLTDGMHRRIIEQGYEMGRPSRIALSLFMQRGRLETVRIGGYAVRVSEGTMEV